MVKRMFALASVTALSGLVSAAGVVGCSSSSDRTPETTNDVGAESDKTKTDSGTPSPTPTPDDDDTSSSAPSCYAASGFQMPAQYAYQKVGAKTADACTEDQIYAFSDALRAAAKKSEIDFSADIAPAIGTTGACVDCIHGSATEWRVYNEMSLFHDNQFGCLELKGVITTACASALYGYAACMVLACSRCTSQRDADACEEYANAHDCGKIDTSACNLSKNLSEILEENNCGDSVNIANNFCGSGTALESDGGL